MAILYFSDVLKKVGLNPEKVKLIRHSRNKKDFMECLKHKQVLEYTAQQDAGFGRGFTHWAVFVGEAGTKARFYDLYEVGESVPDTLENMPEGFLFPECFQGKRAYYDLKSPGLLEDYKNKLVIEWGDGTRAWKQNGSKEKEIVALAPPVQDPFPGYEQVLLSFEEMKERVEDDILYADWQAALRSVQGVYVIADTKTDKLYVGSATGKDGILGRWKTYAHNGHGGNTKLKELVGDDIEKANRFQFSILQEFSMKADTDAVLAAEDLYKKKLRSCGLDGLNGN